MSGFSGERRRFSLPVPPPDSSGVVGPGVVIAKVSELSPQQKQDAIRRRNGWFKDFSDGEADFPVGSLGEVQTLIAEIGIRSRGDDYGLVPLVDLANPTARQVLEAEGEQIIDWIGFQTSGPDSQELLARLPDGIRLGKDKKYRAYQIRLFREGTPEAQANYSVLLVNLIHRRDSDRAFMLPDDDISHLNWQILNEAHLRKYPEKYRPLRRGVIVETGEVKLSANPPEGFYQELRELVEKRGRSVREIIEEAVSKQQRE